MEQARGEGFLGVAQFLNCENAELESALLALLHGVEAGAYSVGEALPDLVGDLDLPLVGLACVLGLVSELGTPLLGLLDFLVLELPWLLCDCPLHQLLGFHRLLTELEVLLLDLHQSSLLLDELCRLRVGVRVEGGVRLIVVGVEQIQWLDDLRCQLPHELLRHVFCEALHLLAKHLHEVAQ